MKAAIKFYFDIPRMFFSVLWIFGIRTSSLELVYAICCLITNLGCCLKKCKVFFLLNCSAFVSIWGWMSKWIASLFAQVCLCQCIYNHVVRIPFSHNSPLLVSFDNWCCRFSEKNFPITSFEAFVLLSYTLLCNTMVLLDVF